MRTFVAIELPDVVKARLASIQDAFKEGKNGLKPVSEKNIHITMKFLGDLDEDTIERVKETLTACVKEFEPFEDEIDGLGVFPNVKAPRVVWAGTKEGKKITELHDSLDRALNKMGFVKDRNFHPHATIFRVRDGKTKHVIVKALKENIGFSAGRFPVKDLTLFASELTRKGPIYRKLASFPLGD